MNLQYLETLPEVKNKYGFELIEGEKIVYTTELGTFGDYNDQRLDWAYYTPKFAFTNKRILVRTADDIVYTNDIVWTIDLERDVKSIKRVNSKLLFFFKSTHFEIDLKDKISYGGKSTKYLTGFHIYFKDEENDKFEELINKIF